MTDYRIHRVLTEKLDEAIYHGFMLPLRTHYPFWSTPSDLLQFLFVGEGNVLRAFASSTPVWWHLLSLRKVLSPGHPGKVRFSLHLALPMSWRVTYDQLRKKDVSPSNRSIMKKQAHYTPDTPIKASAQAAGYLREDFRDLDHEESWILLLNGAHLPLAKKMITVGTIKSTQIDHRRIIKEALLTNATAIILFHNHPSGTPVPSVADINETNKLKKACDIFDISLLDHIILTDESYYSFAEETQNKF